MDYICVHLVSGLLPCKPWPSIFRTLFLKIHFKLSRYFLSARFYQPWEICFFPTPHLFYFIIIIFFFLEASKSKQICRDSNNFAVRVEEKKIVLSN